MTTPNENTTVDTSQAMLVSLSFNLCRQSVQLRDESRKIEQQAGAKSGTVKSAAFYFQEQDGSKTNDGLAELKSHMNEWRAQHNRLTRVWDANNTRLLPAQLVPQYMEAMNKFKDGIQVLVDKFVAEGYPLWSASAPARMGELYAKSKFPTMDEVKEKIGYDIAYLPLPDAKAFERIAIISPDLAKTMENTTNERVVKAVAEAQAQTWADVMKPIQHIVETLGKEGKIKIYDSLLGNVISIVDLVPAFNLEKDPKLAELAAMAKEKLGSITTEDLRKSDEVRKETLKTATTILNSFAPFQRKFGEEATT